MRLSRLIGNRFKERPADAMLDSHAFLLRGGYARQVANGIYSLLPPGLRVIRKIEAIIREEMDRLGMQEVLMPLVLPRELWEESGRYGSVGPELARFSDRSGHGMLLAMTHEEAVVGLCRNEITSHAQLPFSVYQIQTKFRDEARSRGGLIRVREFTMKDAYSFHASQADLETFYCDCLRAYLRIFQRVGIAEVATVGADTGMMGGQVAHEFTLLTDVGEDTVAVCDSCSYRANMDVARGRFSCAVEDPQPLEKVHTPAKKTIEDVATFLGVEPAKTAKAVFYENDAQGRLVLVVVRGDLEVNEAKVSRLMGVEPVPASEERIRAAGAVPGFASPLGLDAAKCRVIVDTTVEESSNLVCGANEEDYHLKNFNVSRDLPGATCADIARVVDGVGCPICEGTLHLRRGIEVGNIFQLGTKYTESMNMTFTDDTGTMKYPVMGCYGIGIGRLMCSVIEARKDAYGPRWPMPIAPWQVHINALKLDNPVVRDAAERLYARLGEQGVEVVYDDRNASPGVQFADADLLGVPVRLIVSERNLASGQVEFKRRDTGDKGTVPLDNVEDQVAQWIADALAC